MWNVSNPELFNAHQEDVDAIFARLDVLKKEAQENISALEELQGGVQQDRTAAVDLLNKGKAAQQVQMDQT